MRSTLSVADCLQLIRIARVNRLTLKGDGPLNFEGGNA